MKGITFFQIPTVQTSSDFLLSLDFYFGGVMVITFSFVNPITNSLELILLSIGGTFTES